jgi:membrane fusion protein (multidrug efflux system)
MRVLVLLTLVACKAGGGDAPDADRPAPPDPRTLVEVVPVTAGTVADQVVASATLESVSQATVVPETAGIVTKLLVEEGDTVRKGQLLAELESPQFDAALERADAEFERTQADADAAEKLYGQNALSRAERDAARQALRLARTARDEAGRTRGRVRLVSPIAGTVATRAVRRGELAAGQPAFTIVDLDQLRVVVPLPERDLARVKPGQAASVAGTWEGAASTGAHVARLSPVIDPATGTFRATLDLEDGAPFRPGQFVRVRIDVDRHSGVPTVPRAALVYEDGIPHVYTVVEMTPDDLAAEAKIAEGEDKPDEQGGFSFAFGEKPAATSPAPLSGPARKAVRTRVTLGYEDDGVVELLEGPAPGTSVVVAGNEALRDGARVRLAGDPSRTATAGATDAANAGTQP